MNGIIGGLDLGPAFASGLEPFVATFSTLLGRVMNL